MTYDIDERKRWLALTVLCLGVLMIVLDTTIVNVALPSIRADLGFTETSLVWVVNAYILTFGGFLLLGGRLGDLFGHRRLFLLGVTLFTLASAACGLANSQGLLIAARAVQGLGGAVVSAVSLSLIMNLFTSPADRAKAMGIYGFVGGGGGSIGVLLGGLLTSALSWATPSSRNIRTANTPNLCIQGFPWQNTTSRTSTKCTRVRIKHWRSIPTMFRCWSS